MPSSKENTTQKILLEKGEFASISVQRQGELEVYVRQTRPAEKKFCLLVYKGSPGLYGKDLWTSEKFIDKVHWRKKASPDIRKWKKELQKAYLLNEYQIISNAVGDMQRVCLPRSCPVVWSQYDKAINNILRRGNSPAQKKTIDTALAARKSLLARKNLGIDRKLSRSTKRKLKRKNKMRNRNARNNRNPSQTVYTMPSGLEGLNYVVMEKKKRKMTLSSGRMSSKYSKENKKISSGRASYIPKIKKTNKVPF